MIAKQFPKIRCLSMMKTSFPSFPIVWSILPELVAVFVLLFHIHEIVEGDEVGSVIDVEDARLDVLDVAAVVVDVVGRSLPIGEYVVIVPVVDDEQSAWLDDVPEVLKTFLVVPIVIVIVPLLLLLLLLLSLMSPWKSGR